MKPIYSVIGDGNFCLQSILLLLDHQRSISCIFSKDLQILQISKQHAIPYFQIFEDYQNYLTKQTHTNHILLLNPTFSIPEEFHDLKYSLIHCQNSLLPLYPFDYASSLVILNKEKESGITWHTCEGSLHQGKILIQKKYPILDSDSALSVSVRGFELGINSFIQMIDIIESASISQKEQSLIEKRIPQPFLEHGIINFDSSADQIINLFCACDYGTYHNPFHVTKMLIRDSLFFVKKAEITSSKSRISPGTVVDINKPFLTISTRDKDVKLKGFYDLNQVEWDSQTLCEAYKINPKDSLSDKIKCLTSLNEVRRSENDFYLNFLEKKELDLSFFKSKRHDSSSFSHDHFVIHLSHEYDVQDIIMLLFIYLYKLNNYEDFSLDILNEKTLKLTRELELHTFSGIPFHYNLSENMRIKDVKKIIQKDFVNTNLCVPKDIIYRFPGLELNPHWPMLLFIGGKPPEALMKKQSIVLSLHPETRKLTLYWNNLQFKGENETAPFRDFLVRFLEMVETISSDEQKIIQLPLLTKAERHLIIEDWNKTQKNYQREKSFMELFRNIVKQYPERIAVESRERQVTYEALLKAVERVGGNLFKKNVNQQDVVAIFMTRDIDFWTVLLGIWHINAIYLPIDTGLPAKRIATILKDSKAKVVVTDEKFHKLAIETCAEHSTVTEIKDLLRETSVSINFPGGKQKHAAFIIYTSGSTGDPKGAVIEHQGMLNHAYAKIADLKLTKEDKVAQTATQSFDISIWQFIAPLLVGGISSIFVGQDACEPEFLVDSVERQRPQILQLVPSHMMVILDELENKREKAFKSLRWLFLTGEGLNQHICKRWLTLYPHVNIMNGYGATEVSDDTCHFILTKNNYASYPDIMPVSGVVMNSQLYTLDKFMDPLPIGCKGEIYMGGEGIGRGYLNDPSKTALAFFPDAFLSISGMRIYRTGDIGVFQHDGVLDYLGRKDNQVKLRGHRIEIGEIEGTLLKFEEIAQATAIIREDLVGQKRLIAYLVLYNHQTYNKEKYEKFLGSLKNRLSQVLPEYMIPNDVVFMQQFPLLSNGKLDKKSLPKPNQNHIRESQYHPPENELEDYLVNLWTNVLNIKKIGVMDHFFKIGGHSLFAMKIMAQIRKEFALTMPSSYLFQYPTIRQLSLQIKNYKELV